MGQETPDAGEFKVGETVVTSYVDQAHAGIDVNKSVWELISGGTEMMEIAGKVINSRAYVSRFNFNGADQQKKVAVLSGGSATVCI